MILESIVTTLNANGDLNVAPMGPEIDGASFDVFELRPFQSSQTFENLNKRRQGVLHVTDDVRVFAHAALGDFDLPVTLEPARRVAGQILSEACRWYEFEVQHLDVSSQRACVVCRTVHQESRREFIGFNRAKHAVIEACILATRLEFLPTEYVCNELRQLEKIVEKTGGESEVEAFGFVTHRIDSIYQEHEKKVV